MKDRGHTEKRLLDAVGDLVREEGFSAVGVNRVSQRAGVSKVLIYRYFDSMDGLLRAWVLENNYWAKAAEGAAGEAERIAAEGGGDKGRQYRDLMQRLLREQGEAVRRGPVKREVLRWLLTAESPAGRESLQRIEERGRELSAAFRRAGDFPADVEAGAALLIGGIYYLAMMADRVAAFNGVDLRSPEGWERLYAACGGMIDHLMDGGAEDGKED